MDKLWAPWRINYIQTIPENKKCIFCEALSAENENDRYLLLKTEHSLVMLNIYPYNNGHLLVAPRRHTGNIQELSAQEHLDIMSTSSKMIGILKKVLNPDGFNLGLNLGKSGGAGIAEHLHMHIVPRWTGDTNFMSTCSDTKIISQSLKESFNQLKQCLNETT